MWQPPSALTKERSRQMPQGTQRTGKGLLHVLFLSAALSLLSALVRRERRQLVLTVRDRRKKVRVAPRRIAASLAFATLFFAGAALSAGAGNGVVQLIDPANDSAAPADTTTTTGDPAAGDTAPGPNADGQPAANDDGSPAEQQPAPQPDQQPQSGSESGATSDDAAPASQSQDQDGAAENTKVAGVRSNLRARLHAGLQKPGLASTSHARPGSAAM